MFRTKLFQTSLPDILVTFSIMAATRKPKLIIFDVDYTLWPFWADTHVVSPFRKEKVGTVLDGRNRKVKYYSDSPVILQTLSSEGYELAVASRSDTPDRVRSILKLLDWEKCFSYTQIYPGTLYIGIFTSNLYFDRLKKQSGTNFNDMLFFDDEPRNISDTSELGVHAVLVERGINWKVVNDALDQFAAKR
ncbi:magnesium-dependent phosphatase 1-like [Watersipora subatra]|uniref:magnesium-dependent phosphatase 1-like n=1 Tax=Watersipora subatra TaxID=2589382 RepID=UPI00355BF9A1